MKHSEILKSMKYSEILKNMKYSEILKNMKYSEILKNIKYFESVNNETVSHFYDPRLFSTDLVSFVKSRQDALSNWVSSLQQIS